MTELITENITGKLKQIKRRVSAKHTSSYVTPPEFQKFLSKNKELAQPQNTADTDLKQTLEIIRQNFKKFNTSAANCSSSPLVRKEGATAVMGRLSKYLDITLKDFTNNVKRFMPNTKNTDYKLNISVGGRDNTDVRIEFTNPQGKRIGPFLNTHITISPLNQHDVLSVNIGYIDKHKQPIIIHSFGYDMFNDVSHMVEQRGDKTYLKTDKELQHDKYSDILQKETKMRLRHKNDMFEL